MTGAPKRRPEESYLHNTSEVSFLPPEVAGSIARVPAPEIETSCAMGSAGTLQLMGDGEPATATADRDLIERHVARVIVKPQALDVCLIPASEASAQTEDPSLQDPAPRRPLATTITLAWTAPSFAAVKGIVHAPCAKPAMRPESRDALLQSPRPGDGSTT